MHATPKVGQSFCKSFEDIKTQNLKNLFLEKKLPQNQRSKREVNEPSRSCWKPSLSSFPCCGNRPTLWSHSTISMAVTSFVSPSCPNARQSELSGMAGIEPEESPCLSGSMMYFLSKVQSFWRSLSVRECTSRSL